MTQPSARPRILVVRNDPAVPPALLGTWLQQAGVEVVELDASAGEQVPVVVPEGVDGIVSLGGTMSATSDDLAPWLPAERALIADAVHRGTPLFGVCLGAQLMAVALGGEVRRAAPGEAGVTELMLTPLAGADPVFGGLPGGAPVAQYHGDEVVRLPAGAVLLASSAACAHQIWRIGQAAWAVQGHPEVDAQIMDRWTGASPEHARRCGTDPAAVVAAVRDGAEELAQVWAPVAAAFAAVVRDTRSRPGAGAAAPR